MSPKHQCAGVLMQWGLVFMKLHSFNICVHEITLLWYMTYMISKLIHIWNDIPHDAKNKHIFLEDCSRYASLRISGNKPCCNLVSSIKRCITHIHLISLFVRKFHWKLIQNYMAIGYHFIISISWMIFLYNLSKLPEKCAIWNIIIYQ